MKYRSLFSLTIVLMIIGFSSIAQSNIYSSSKIQLELKKLNFLGNALYLAAHPDDENTRLITWLDNEKLARTAYLSLTRGDGGQNLIGTEKGAAMGLLRTQELIEARKIDGGEQFFSRAVDFGYSKTAKETFEIWEKDKILADAVWVIRKFKPDVIVTRFPPDERAGHGHHTASAMIAIEAFKLAADENAYPEQLKLVDTWQVKRLYWNASNWWNKGIAEEAAGNDKYFVVDAGGYSPLLGESNGEIAAKSRSSHRSQGFGAAMQRGENLEYLYHLEGEKAINDLFDGVNTSWKTIKGGDKIQAQIDAIIANFKPNQPQQSIAGLVKLYNNIKANKNLTPHATQKLADIQDIIKTCSGVFVEALAEDFSGTENSEVKVSAQLINRNGAAVKATFSNVEGQIELPKNQLIEKDFTIKAPSEISQPYWLTSPYFGVFGVDQQELIGLPESPAAVNLDYQLTFDGTTFTYSTPLLYKWTDRVEGEIYRRFIVTPKATGEFSSNVLLFADEQPKEVSLIIKAHENNTTGKATLTIPKGWETTASQFDYNIAEKGQKQVFKFTVTPPKGGSVGDLSIQLSDGSEMKSEQLIKYNHIEYQTLFDPLVAKVVKVDFKRAGDRIGYIMGSGDEVPNNLKEVGYTVELIEADNLNAVDLSVYDAIIVGIRAYNTTESLKNGNLFLNDYVKNGGNVIVQYNTNRGLVTEDIGPYKFQISRERVTKEEAEVTFIDPKAAVLNFPNKLTKADFDGWVQERGLYFADEWDENFTPILSWNDPDEDALEGGLIVAKYGEGHFVYTGISFFRQLPAAVPGAYRLMSNIIGLGKK